MTGRKKAAEKMATFARKLERSNRELQDFASVASHDLQEPLRKIQAFGDRLRAKCYAALDESGRDYLERMQNAASRMRSLIDDLLTFSRVSSKAQPFVPTDLGQVAREVLQDLEVRIQHSGGQVEVDNLPTIDADPLQVRQLLQNLIGNGLKFHRQEEPPAIRVRARLIVDPRKYAGNGAPAPLCELSVEDNGIGFDMKYAERLFHVFQRLHGRGEYEGTGMGLAICRRIAERHGGSIAARATPGRGATFTVILPVKQPLLDEKVSGTFSAVRTASAANGGVAEKVPDTFSSTSEART
jgi:light-regulated signal transduction histidine kinase (bacteriophytochrome)